MPRGIKLDRSLSLTEVADLLQLKHSSQARRREHVMRLFRRLERTQGKPFLHSHSPRGKLFVRLSAIEELHRWHPGGSQQLRRDLDDLSVEVRHLGKKQNAHGARLRQLERFKIATAQYLAEIGSVMADE